MEEASLGGQATDTTARPQAPVRLATGLLVGVLAFAAVRQGAFYPRELRVLVVVSLLAAAAAFVSRPPERGDLVAPVAAAIALGGWAATSAWLAGAVTGAMPAVGLLAALAGVVVVLRRADERERETVVSAVLLIGALVAISGWAGVAWRHWPQALEDQALWRAASTITYANATAAVLAALALLALARLGERCSVAGALTAWLLVTGLGATLSRAGLVGFAFGVVVLARLIGVRQVLSGWPIALGAAVAVVGLVPSMPASQAPRPLVAVVALAAGGVVAVAGTHSRGRRPLAAVLAIAVVAGLAAGTSGIGPGLGRTLSTRMTLQSSDRTNELVATLELARDHPLTGVGPGRFLLTWTDGGQAMVATYAHNEYLQVLAEMGAIGFGILIGGLVLSARAVLRSRQGAPPWLSSGCVGGLAALALHSAADFLWHVPVVAMIGATLVGLALPGARSNEGSTS